MIIIKTRKYEYSIDIALLMENIKNFVFASSVFVLPILLGGLANYLASII